MTVRNKTDARLALKGGAIAGIVAGIVLSLFLLAGNVAGGRDLWLAMKGSGAPFLAQRAMQPGFDAVAVIVGVLCHFAVSITWGVLFAFLCFGLSKSATMIAGLFWGLVVYLGMFFVVLPAVGLGSMAQGAPIAATIVEHLLFGIVMGAAFLPYQREIPRAAMPGAPRPSL